MRYPISIKEVTNGWIVEIYPPGVKAQEHVFTDYNKLIEFIAKYYEPKSS